mgnify:CR=1 FL=1
MVVGFPLKRRGRVKCLNSYEAVAVGSLLASMPLPFLESGSYLTRRLCGTFLTNDENDCYLHKLKTTLEAIQIPLREIHIVSKMVITL